MIIPRFLTPGLLLPALAWPILAASTGEIELLTEELPWAVVDRAYLPAPLEARVTGRCPAGGIGFTVASGTLPPGLKLSRLGYFSGIPTQYGLFEFNVRAVNGCSWSARHFELLVTEPPKLKMRPERISVDCPAGASPPPAALHLTATWPQLAYLVSITYRSTGNNWVTAVPEHGRTSREAVPRRLTEVPGDDISLHFDVMGLKPGRYEAQLSISAWQAQTIVVTVILNIDH